RVLPHLIGAVGKVGKELRPARVHALGIGFVPGVKRLDIIGISAIKEGGEEERFVLVLSCHFALYGGPDPPLKNPTCRFQFSAANWVGTMTGPDFVSVNPPLTWGSGRSR